MIFSRVGQEVVLRYNYFPIGASVAEEELDRAKKKFAECVRRGKGTKWAELAEKELAAFPE